MTADQQRFENWAALVSTVEPGDEALLNAAFAAAPAQFGYHTALMPRRKPVEDTPCRICWSAPASSKEHVPPQVAGNRESARVFTLDEWLARDELDLVTGGRVEQGGTFGYTLCRACNSKMGERGRGLTLEYRDWQNAAAGLLSQRGQLDVLDASEQSRVLSIGLFDMRPGAFVRQVLSMMCSVADQWRLTERYPQLRDALLEGAVCDWPVELFLGMGLCAGPQANLAGPMIKIDRTTRTWRWICQIAFPPFVFELTLAASGRDFWTPMCGIGEFLEVDERVQGNVELDVLVAFTHLPVAGDFRTRRQVETDLRLDGRRLG